MAAGGLAAVRRSGCPAATTRAPSSCSTPSASWPSLLIADVVVVAAASAFGGRTCWARPSRQPVLFCPQPSTSAIGGELPPPAAPPSCKTPASCGAERRTARDAACGPPWRRRPRAGPRVRRRPHDARPLVARSSRRGSELNANRRGQGGERASPPAPTACWPRCPKLPRAAGRPRWSRARCASTATLRCPSSRSPLTSAAPSRPGGRAACARSPTLGYRPAVVSRATDDGAAAQIVGRRRSSVSSEEPATSRFLPPADCPACPSGWAPTVRGGTGVAQLSRDCKSSSTSFHRTLRKASRSHGAGGASGW